MNAADRAKLRDIHHYGNVLMNAGVTGSGITNADVIEALLSDIQSIEYGREAMEMKKLIDRDAEFITRGKS